MSTDVYRKLGSDLLEALRSAEATGHYVAIYKPVGEQWRARVGDTNYFADSIEDIAAALTQATEKEKNEH